MSCACTWYRSNTLCEIFILCLWVVRCSLKVLNIMALILLVAEARSHSTDYGWLLTDSQLCAARLYESWWVQNDVHCLQECHTLSSIECLIRLPRGVDAGDSWQDWSVNRVSVSICWSYCTLLFYVRTLRLRMLGWCIYSVLFNNFSHRISCAEFGQSCVLFTVVWWCGWQNDYLVIPCCQ